MTDTPATRPVDPDDADRIREIAERSMTASYDLSPREIEAIADAAFDAESVRAAAGAADIPAFVAELDDSVVGFAEGSVSDETGTLRWLHVDPDYRGRGAGTALFERTVAALRDRASGGARVSVVAADREGTEFVERFGFRTADERETEIGDRAFLEEVYVDPSDDGAAPDATAPGADDPGELPDTVTAADGEAVFPGDDRLSGTDGPFVPTYADANRTEEHGYCCVACGSTDVSMDSMERLRCAGCGNVHKPEDRHDGSYL